MSVGRFQAFDKESQRRLCESPHVRNAVFRVVPRNDGKTLLQFGSAVASRSGSRPATRISGSVFRLLFKFHVVYSQVLLHSAKRGVMRQFGG
jgi:hypothetical protein